MRVERWVLGVDHGEGDVEVEGVVQILENGVFIVGQVRHAIALGDDFHFVSFRHVIVAVIQALRVLIIAAGHGFGEHDVLKCGHAGRIFRQGRARQAEQDADEQQGQEFFHNKPSYSFVFGAQAPM